MKKKTMFYLGALDLAILSCAYYFYSYGYDFEVFSIGLVATCLGVYRLYEELK